MSFRSWFRRVVEKLAKRFYEGPEAPDRLGMMVEDFAAYNAHATRGDWIEFAKAHGDECYRSGYMRGLEALHRQLEEGGPILIAEDDAHDWEWERIPTTADLQLQEPVEDALTTLQGHHDRIEWRIEDDRERVGKRRSRV